MVAVAGGVSDSTEAYLDVLEEGRAYVGGLPVIARAGGVEARSGPEGGASNELSAGDQERLLRVLTR